MYVPCMYVFKESASYTSNADACMYTHNLTLGRSRGEDVDDRDAA